MRADLERVMSELEALLEQGDAQAGAAPRGRAARRPPAALTSALDRARTALQEARTAVGSGDYMKATTLLMGVQEDLEGALAPAASTAAPQSSRGRR